jgi:hypothetical protein
MARAGYRMIMRQAPASRGLLDPGRERRQRESGYARRDLVFVVAGIYDKPLLRLDVLTGMVEAALGRGFKLRLTSIAHLSPPGQTSSRSISAPRRVR